MFSYIPACCCVVCCYAAVAAAAAACCLLLLVVIVGRMAKFVSVVHSLRVIPVYSSSSFKHDLFSMHPLAILSHFQRRFLYLWYVSYILGITGMRGAKAGVSPPRRSPPCMYTYIMPGTIQGYPWGCVVGLEIWGVSRVDEGERR